MKKIGLILSRFMAVILLSSALMFSAPKPANAVCVTVFCAVPGTISGTIALSTTPIVTALNTAYNTIMALWNSLLSSYETAVNNGIDEAENNIIDWYDMYWWYDLRPSMQDMTGQLVTADVDQTRAIGSFFDAQQQNTHHLAQQLAEIDGHRSSRPGEQVCVVGTMGGGMTRANTVRRAMGRALSDEHAAITTNRRYDFGTTTPRLPTADGRASDSEERWSEYVARYCNSDDNAGSAGCAAMGSTPGFDVNITDMIFSKDTIDMTDANIRASLKELSRNLLEPVVMEPIPAEVIGDVGTGIVGVSEGRINMLQRRSLAAQRLLAYEAFDHILARRMPGSRLNEGPDNLIQNLRERSGVNVADISSNPSYEEVVNAVISERFRTGVYHNDLISDPAVVKSELVTLQAWHVIQQHDQLDLMDRFAMLLAAQVANEVNASGGK